MFRYANGQLTRFTTNNSPLPHNWVLALFEDSKTNLWVGTAGGLCRFTNNTFINYTNSPGLITEAVRAILEDSQGNLWIGTAKGLSRYDGVQFVTYTTRDFLLSDAISTLCEDRHGALWIGTSSGLTRYWKGKIRHFTERQGLANNIVRIVKEDSSGRLWVGTQGGLQLVENEKIASVKVESLNDPGFKMNSFVYSVAEDREGNLWVGTHIGLHQLRNLPFTVYSKEHGLPEEIVTSICQQTNGTIWIGTYGGGLVRIRGNEQVTFKPEDGLPGRLILSLWPSPKNGLWIGLDRSGLSWLQNGNFTNFISEDPKLNVVRSVMQDHYGQVWTGSNGGISRLKKNRMIPEPLPMPKNTIKAIVQDRERSIWLVGDEGLLKINDSAVTRYRSDSKFVSDNANALFACEDGHLFVGADSGLFCFQDGRFKHINTLPELHNRRILSILEDDFGNLWMSTQTGVLTLSKKDLLLHAANPAFGVSITSFGKSEGMRRAQCNGIGQPSSWKTQDGRVWIATMNGVAIFNPKAFRHNTVPPPVVIEQMAVDGRPVTDSFEKIPPNKGSLEFTYTALSLQCPEKVRFKYKLDGVDSTWVDAGSRRQASYANVAPGKYTLRVMACNNDGLWCQEEASLHFNLQPHFYRTGWFAALSLSIVCGLVGITIRSRRKAVHRRELALQREIAVRTEKLEKSLKTMESFNYSIAHDLRAPLRAIRGFTEALMDDYHHTYTEEGKAYSRRISEAVDRMDNLIGDLLKFGNISHKKLLFENVQLGELASNVLEDLRAEFEHRRAEIKIDRPLGSVWANETLLHQVLQNLISNALKFVAADKTPYIHIWTERRGSKQRICIRDNGIGIAKEHQERIFGMFERLHSTELYPGTGIGLAIVMKAVERMEGTVGVQSEPGKGSCFWIELPGIKS